MSQCSKCDRLLSADGICKVHGVMVAPLASTVAAGGTLAAPGATAPEVAVPVSSGDDLPVGEVVDAYVIDGRIGAGGMGVVYAATHPVIGKRAAVKTITRDRCENDRAVSRFINEAKAVNQIGHPNIVDVFALGTLPDGRSYLIMELLHGESVRERLDREPPPTLGEMCDILVPMCRALEAAHAAGVVHRDLKPENVFLASVPGEAPQVKILDFGIAKLEEAAHQVASTETGQLLGTPGYMSPEQARGRDIGSQTDVYSLGVMAYELATGQRPLHAESTAEVIAKLLTEKPADPGRIRGDLPLTLRTLLMAMLEKDPKLRPSLDVVREVLGALPAQARQRTQKARGVRSLALVAGVLVGGLGIVTYSLDSSDRVREGQSPPARGQHGAPMGIGPAARLPSAAVEGDAGMVDSMAVPQSDAAPPREPHEPAPSKRRRRPPAKADPPGQGEDDDAPMNPFGAN